MIKVIKVKKERSPNYSPEPFIIKVNLSRPS